MIEKNKSPLTGHQCPEVLSKDVFKCSEIAEFYIALFLFSYIISIKTRLSEVR